MFRARTYKSSDDDYLMNDIRRKPTTGARFPTLFDKSTGIFVCPVADRAIHTKAFIYPAMDHLGESQSAPAHSRFELPTYQSTVAHANHQTMMTTPSQRINYTGSSTGGGVSRLKYSLVTVCWKGFLQKVFTIVTIVIHSNHSKLTRNHGDLAGVSR